MDIGKSFLGSRHVQPAVPTTLKELHVEATFPSGTYLITVHNPICTDVTDLELALFGSFLPVPDEKIFPPAGESGYELRRQPGAVQVVKGERITLNKGRERIRLEIVNTGDRPIQVKPLILYSQLGTYFSANSLGWKSLPFHRDKSVP